MINQIYIIRKAMTALEESLVSSCTCMTKTPEASFHDRTCPYRIRKEALDGLTKLVKDLGKKEPFGYVVENNVPKQNPYKWQFWPVEYGLNFYKDTALAITPVYLHEQSSDQDVKVEEQKESDTTHYSQEYWYNRARELVEAFNKIPLPLSKGN